MKSSRADRIVRLRDLICLGISHNVRDRDGLIELARKSGTFVTEKGNRPYDYSSIYRYLAALLFLKFDLADNISSPVVWSPEAKMLAEISTNSHVNSELTEQEKEILRTQIFRSPVNEQFLTSFNSEGLEPRNQTEFVRSCQPLYVLGIKRRPMGSAGKDWFSDKVVEITLDPILGPIKQKAVMEFLYTYRLWCLDVEMIEEINVKEAGRSGIAKDRSHVLYPVTIRPLPSPAEFLDLLYGLTSDQNRANVLSMPKLLYTLCVDLRMTVRDFKILLVETWEKYRHLLHLERGPGILIKGDLATNAKSYSERFGNHRYYINIDGTIRSNLVLRPRETTNEAI